MEDAHTHILNLSEDKDCAFFGGAWSIIITQAKLDFDTKYFKFLFTVYDGHGGAKIAAHVSKNLHKFIVRRPEYKQGNYEDAIVKVWNLAIPSYLTYFKVKRFFRPSWSVTRQRERTSL